MIETTVFDPAEVLDTPAAEVEFIAAAFESGDAAHITNALGIVARARGMSQIARDAGVTREALYKALSEKGDPKLSTILGVLSALGVELSARAA